MSFIEVGEEVEKTVYDFPVEMDDEMFVHLFEYARNVMTEEEFEKIMVGWAMTDIIEKSVTETLNKLAQEDK